MEERSDVGDVQDEEPSFSVSRMLGILDEATEMMKIGDFEEAATHVTLCLLKEELEATVPKWIRSRAYHIRAKSGLKRTEYRQALLDVEMAISLKGEYSPTYLTKARILHAMGRTEEGIETLNQALLFEPEDVSCLNERGDLFLRVIGEYDKSLETYDRLVSLFPSNSTAFNNRGLVYSALQQYERAIEDFDQSLLLEESSVCLYNRALSHQELGRFDAAILDCDRCIAIDPKNAKAYSCRGSASKNLQKLHNALADFNHALTLDETLAEAYTQRGLTLYHLDRNSQALEDINKAIELTNRADPHPFVARSVVYADMKRTTDAVTDLRCSLSINPKYPPALFRLGKLHCELDEIDTALTYLDRLLEIVPTHVDAMLQKGYALLKKGEFALAKRMFREAKLLNPKNVFMYSNRAKILKGHRQFEGALAALDEGLLVIANVDERSHLLQSKLEIHLELKRYRAARKDLDRLIDLEPTKEEWVQLRRKIVERF